MGKHPEVKSSIARLLKKQKGKCNQCNLAFRPEDRIERDHVTPRQAGGNKLKDNLQLLHRHCHDVKTKQDLKTIQRYKFHKGWDKVYKRFQSQFEKSNWIWDNDLPTVSQTGTHNQSLIREEPYEVKVSRTVLKTSRLGDEVA